MDINKWATRIDNIYVFLDHFGKRLDRSQMFCSEWHIGLYPSLELDNAQ